MCFLSRAWAEDLAQRILTLNKLEQRRSLARLVSGLDTAPGTRVLDFGCGTGLFAPTLLTAGLDYYGYDPDPGAVRLARERYSRGSFLSSQKDLDRAGPFGLILANCCFHHIQDQEAGPSLDRLARLLKPRGTLLIIDILKPQGRVNPLRRLFLKLEQGAHLRSAGEYRGLVEGRFRVRREKVRRSHVLSFPSPLNPFYNDLLILECASLQCAE